MNEMPQAIAEAISAVAGQVKKLGFDEKNEHGGYRAVSVDKFYTAIGPTMAEAGLFLLCTETKAELHEKNTNKGPVTWLFTSYDLSFAHKSGCVSSPLTRSCALPLTGPQAFGAAQSYIEKQFLRQVFKIPTGEKDADLIAPDAGEGGFDKPTRENDRFLTKHEVDSLATLISDVGADTRKLCDHFGVDSITVIPASRLHEVEVALESHRAAKARRAAREAANLAANAQEREAAQ